MKMCAVKMIKRSLKLWINVLSDNASHSFNQCIGN